MTDDRMAAILSTVAALVIVVATWFQWWDITYEGGMRARPWVRVMLAVVAAALVVALVFLFLD
jgi:hypothetical protein